jgi:hypothetical protein
VPARFLYHGYAVDSSLLVTLSTLSSAQAKGTEAMARTLIHLLNYCATHPNTTVHFHASDMCHLHISSNASYLSEPKACSHVGGHFYLSSTSANPNKPPSLNAPLPHNNGAIHMISNILHNIMASATEAKLGAVFHNAKEGATLCTTLHK